MYLHVCCIPRTKLNSLYMEVYVCAYMYIHVSVHQTSQPVEVAHRETPTVSAVALRTRVTGRRCVTNCRALRMLKCLTTI